MRRIVAGFVPLSVSAPMHQLHVFRHIAGRPKTEKDGDSCRVAAVHAGELRWKGIHRYLESNSGVYLWQRKPAGKLTLIPHVVGLNTPDRFFFDGYGNAVRAEHDMIELPGVGGVG